MANGYATKRQLWALFCITKVKTQNMLLGFEQATDLIRRANNKEDITQELIDLGGEATQKTGAINNLQALFDSADEAGKKAAESVEVKPMVVVGRANPLDDSSPVTEKYFVPSGVCGFASIVVRPGNCAFANFLKKNYGAYKHYYGGTNFPVRAYGQSLQMKEAYAYAFAKVVNEAGIKASVDSRLD